MAPTLPRNLSRMLSSDHLQQRRRRKKNAASRDVPTLSKREEYAFTATSLTHGAKKYVYVCSIKGCINGVCWTHGAKRELKRCRLQGMCTKFVKKGGVWIKHGAKVVGRGNCAQLCRVAPTKSEREECVLNPWRKAPSRECSKFRHEGRSL